uniref:Taste receptor type 2 n=2 Tax=Nannospalax galili TaxID=1026970 RepID=A0A7S6B5M5_NANGA|nr:taste receptor type 2 member 519 [Nannospalax galili]QKE46222.1 taste receptor type 2 member 519 [Nannospalax galili]QKE46234.1 taste receptor type 2 member 519 [Nannospalax galili]QKE46240.1 taste receptor type 2 member 519 [Nannospalax galili]QKE46252.1 taste receptor type 2 member 519 [Nannospalax galili]
MGSALQFILTIVIVVEFIFGHLSNGFIILTNCIDYVNKQKLSEIDKVILILAISRITLIWEMCIWFKTMQDSFFFMTGTGLQFLHFSWVLSNHFSLWLATILSVCYLLKIANISWPIFLFLKWRIKKLVPVIVLGTLLFLVLNLMQTSITLEEKMQWYGRNSTLAFRVSELILFNMTMFSMTPFILALVSFLLLIFSLWRHLQKMKFNSQGHRDPNTEAHMNALRIIISFLLLYAVYFLSLVIAWISQKHHSQLVHFICMITGLMYPSSHSFILILGNSKLKQPCLSMLKHLGRR